MKRKEKGITLIALIITIIVMLILVGVTVNIAIQGGLFSTARKANLETRAAIVEEKAVEWKANKEADEYVENQTAQELEELLNDLEDQNLITPEERVTIEQTGQVTIGSRTIIFEEDGDLAKLKKYFLEEKGMEGFYSDKFPNTETIPDANSSLKPLGVIDCISNANIYIQYNGKAYKVLATGSIYDGSISIKDVEFVYQPHGNEGKKVKYGENNDETGEWTILYDNGDNVEIVSSKSMGSLTLGSNDNTAQNLSEDINNDNKVDEKDKALYSYNNAIETLNEYCTSLIENNNKISVRSVGSNPNSLSNENDTLFTSDILTQWGKDSYNNLVKSTDENYEQDFVRMLYWGLNGGNPFWMASRSVITYSEEGTTGIVLCLFYSDGIIAFPAVLFGIMSDDEAYDVGALRGDQRGCSFAVRPVVKVSSDGITIK